MKEPNRCSWCLCDPIYIHYHDTEWGKPVKDDRVLFEFLILESAQAGLSWLTILRRRENYRKAFADFDAEKVARFTQKDVEILIQNQGIIRHRAKIEAAITNAQCFLETQKAFGSFYDYLYGFMPERKILKSNSKLPVTQNEISKKMSREMKKRRFKFLGPVICYAYMQAVGMVNDHQVDCAFR